MRLCGAFIPNIPTLFIQLKYFVQSYCMSILSSQLTIIVTDYRGTIFCPCLFLVGCLRLHVIEQWGLTSGHRLSINTPPSLHVTHSKQIRGHSTALMPLSLHSRFDTDAWSNRVLYSTFFPLTDTSERKESHCYSFLPVKDVHGAKARAQVTLFMKERCVKVVLLHSLSGNVPCVLKEM